MLFTLLVYITLSGLLGPLGARTPLARHLGACKWGPVGRTQDRPPAHLNRSRASRPQLLFAGLLTHDRVRAGRAQGRQPPRSQASQSA